MALIARESGGGGTFTPVPPGMYLARCYRIVDMGTQITTWKGVSKEQPKVMLQFEVHSEDADGNAVVTDKGEPMSISKNFTASLEEKDAIPAVKQQLEYLRAIQTTEFWESIDLAALEDLRLRLRGLVQFLDKSKRKIVYTNGATAKQRDRRKSEY